MYNKYKASGYKAECAVFQTASQEGSTQTLRQHLPDGAVKVSRLKLSKMFVAKR